MTTSQADNRGARLKRARQAPRGAMILAALSLALGAPSQFAAAQPHADPDWPCVQRKVPSLSSASMWPGLSEEALSADWREDRQVAELVAEIAPRRVPVEEGEEAIRAFAEGLVEGDKEEKLTLLFVGLFQTLGAERSEVMRGIGRYARNQAQLAEQILADRAALEEMRQGAAPGSDQLAQPSQELTMAIRVFEDRRASLAHVCEVPRVIEQRLFSFARVIQAELS
ncbi:MAG TPA: hypothetical protein VHG92_11780 [Afifellaceae bacterium]|nr:hypothetical protein [Afifellaceae bacterium]